MSEQPIDKSSGESGPAEAEKTASSSLKARATALRSSASQGAVIEAAKVVAEEAVVPATEPAKADGAEPPAAQIAAGQTQARLGERRLAPLAAVVALAISAGALGGAFATAALSGKDTANADGHALEQAIARIDAELSNLKFSFDQTSASSESEFNRTRERLDKFEKALAEPAARLARLSDAVEKLRSMPAAAPSVAPAAAPGGESTASINQPPETPAVPLAKPEVRRLPTVEGWVLRYVTNGGALIEGRQGIYEVYAGNQVPGLGRVDAIRRQDGRWVVVTSKGLIVAR